MSLIRAAKVEAKTFVSWIAAVTLAVAVAFPAAAWADEPDGQSGDPAASSEVTGEITVLHTNDIHGFYTLDERNMAIGFPILQTIKNKMQPDLVLDAGDTFHGQSFATLTEGESIAKLMDALGYDATTPGNHDWNYGASQLAALDDGYRFSVLAANVVDADTGAPYFNEPYLIKEVEVELSDGTTAEVTVGVLGVIDEDFYESTAAANVADVKFTDPVEAANDTAQELRDQGCDVVIALTHNADPEGFARQTSGIDAVIAGHEHVVMDEAYGGAGCTAVAVVEAGHYLQYAGVFGLILEYDDNETPDNKADDTWRVRGYTADPVSFDEARGYAADADTQTMVEDIEALVQGEASQIVGQSSQAYPYEPTITGPGGWEKVRTEDTPIGHAVTAAYLAQTGADLAFENAGGIRGGIPEGAVTAGDLLSISPYGNTLATYELKGAEIREALEHSLDISAKCRAVLEKQVAAIEAGEDPMQYSWPDNSGSVLVSGGVTMVIDWDKPEGQRIQSITVTSKAEGQQARSGSVEGEPLDPNRTYVVAMNSYLPQLTDEYPMFEGMSLVDEYGTCEQALRAFVANPDWEKDVYALSGTVSYVQPEEEGEGGTEGEDGKQPEDEQTDTDTPVKDLETPDPAEEPNKLADTGDPAAATAVALCAIATLATATAAVSARRVRR